MRVVEFVSVVKIRVTKIGERVNLMMITKQDRVGCGCGNGKDRTNWRDICRLFAI